METAWQVRLVALLSRSFTLTQIFHLPNYILAQLFADVFLTCDDGFGTLSYQIWINDKSSGFTLARSGKLPEGTQSVSFADMGAYTIQIYIRDFYLTFITNPFRS